MVVILWALANVEDEAPQLLLLPLLEPSQAQARGSLHLVQGGPVWWPPRWLMLTLHRGQESAVTTKSTSYFLSPEGVDTCNIES